MEKRLKVAEFAALIGCREKTVYRLIENNKIKTVKDTYNGRQIVFILTTDEEIEQYKKIYMKSSDNDKKIYDNDINCKDIVTENDSNYYDNVGQKNYNDGQGISNSEIVEKIMTFSQGMNEQILTLNESYNQRLQALTEELIEFKSKVPLLEDKANREGYYLNEINQIKTENEKKLTEINKKARRNYIILTVIIMILTSILLTISGLLLYNFFILEKSNTPDTINSEKIEENSVI